MLIIRATLSAPFIAIGWVITLLGAAIVSIGGFIGGDDVVDAIDKDLPTQPPSH